MEVIKSVDIKVGDKISFNEDLQNIFEVEDIKEVNYLNAPLIRCSVLKSSSYWQTDSEGKIGFLQYNEKTAGGTPEEWILLNESEVQHAIEK